MINCAMEECKKVDVDINNLAYVLIQIFSLRAKKETGKILKALLRCNLSRKICFPLVA